VAIIEAVEDPAPAPLAALSERELRTLGLLIERVSTGG
jgi:hypothetical protein